MTPRLLKTLLLTPMDKVARPRVAAIGAASLIIARHPAMRPTSSQKKTLAVMANVVRAASKSSAASIIS